MRSGVIAEKVGMMNIFHENGSRTPVTVLKLDDCTVVGVRTQEKDGYTAVQLGARKAKLKNVTNPLKGYFAKANVEPKQKLIEFRVSEDCIIPVGSVLGVNHFVVGQKVDVSGTSIGKGFAGVMKRHNFSGDNATHGVSLTHRAGGSTGNREWPGKVFKNRAMPGQLGNKKTTVQNLEIVSLDEEKNLIMVKGSVPGFDSNFLTIVDSVKCSKQEIGPVPAGLKATKASVKAEEPVVSPTGQAEAEVKE